MERDANKKTCNGVLQVFSESGRISFRRGLFGGLGSFLRNNFEQLNFKYQGRERLDLSGFACAIGEFLRNIDFPSRAYRHLLDCFRPSFDDLVALERHGLVALVAAVEDGAIDEFAFVVHLDGLFVSGLRPFSFNQDLVLHSAGECFHALLLGIVGQPFFTGFAIGAILLFH